MRIYTRAYSDGLAALGRVKLVKSPRGNTWTLQIVFTEDGTRIAATEHILLSSWQVDSYREMGVPVAE